jgi:phospholipid/cholesterol/gamma-HCH transport system substrate-binding protein
MSASNPNNEQALELKAGIFVLIGLVFIAMMAFKFGRLGQGLFQQYYPITVTFPSADGLIKNSDVTLAGARIGYVADKPVIAPGGTGVSVDLKILSDVKVPRETMFDIGSSGLLGDKFVEIKDKPGFNPASFNPADPQQVLAPGETINGSPATGLLGDLPGKGEKVFDSLNIEIQKLTVVTDKINQGILSSQNQANISDTLAHLKNTSDHFDVASKDLDATITDAKSAIDSAKTTLGTVNADATDVHSAIDDAQQTLDSVKALLAKAETGNGPVATLLNDQQITDDLKTFVANLRAHGILFYKNKPLPSATPARH